MILQLCPDMRLVLNVTTDFSKSDNKLTAKICDLSSL